MIFRRITLKKYKWVIIVATIITLKVTVSCTMGDGPTSLYLYNPNIPSTNLFVQLGATTAAPGGNNSNSDFCSGVAVDYSGNIYCAGNTSGAIGEESGGNDDVFVMKLSSSGEILWLTQLGATTTATGGNNSGSDTCDDIAVDYSGNVYCAGSTTGSLGEQNAGTTDAFILKLNSSGEILWLTQLGAETKAPGGDNSGGDRCFGIAVDGSGNVYCAGNTTGSMGEENGGDADAFVLKLASDGSILWLTQLGASTTAVGGSNSGVDYCIDVAVDGSGNVYCAGTTRGNMGENNGGSDDAFVMKLSSSGSILWLTHLGAETKADGGNNSGSDYCISIAVDFNGNVYCAGSTSGNLGENNGGNDDAFVMKLSSSGSILWLTHLGAETKAEGGNNSGADICYGVAVDTFGNIICSGYTNGSMGEASGGEYDAFVLKLASVGSILKLTQLGASTAASGGSNSGNDYCRRAAVDVNGNVYCAGYTDGALAETNSGDTDVFVMRLSQD